MAGEFERGEGWSALHYATRANLEAAKTKLLEHKKVTEKTHDVSASFGLENHEIHRFVRIAFNVNEAELEEAPDDVKKVFQDLGIDHQTRLRTSLHLTLPVTSIRSYTEYRLVFNPVIPIEDRYGIELDSSGGLDITPNKTNENVHFMHPWDVIAARNIVDGDSERARMLQEVYMESLQPNGETPHPVVSRILIASSNWIDKLINARQFPASR